MRGVMVEVPEHLIAERHRLGLDKADEMWEGELHMVPPAKDEHRRMEGELFLVLAPLARAAGLHIRVEAGLFDAAVPDDTSYRVPDLMVFGEEARSERGAEGKAELVIEVQSPGDETIAKLPFYGRVGVKELLVIDRDTKAVRRWIVAEGSLGEVMSGPDGWHALDALPVTVRGANGRLQVRAGDDVTEI